MVGGFTPPVSFQITASACAFLRPSPPTYKLDFPVFLIFNLILYHLDRYQKPTHAHTLDCSSSILQPHE